MSGCQAPAVAVAAAVCASVLTSSSFGSSSASSRPPCHPSEQPSDAAVAPVVEWLPLKGCGGSNDVVVLSILVVMPERKTKRPVGRRRVTRVSRGAVSAEDFGNDVLCARARARKFYYLHLLNATPVRAKRGKFLCFRRFGLQISKRRSTYIKKQKVAARVLCFGPPASPSVRGTRPEHRGSQSSQSIGSSS